MVFPRETDDLSRSVNIDNEQGLERQREIDALKAMLVEKNEQLRQIEIDQNTERQVLEKQINDLRANNSRVLPMEGETDIGIVNHAGNNSMNNACWFTQLNLDIKMPKFHDETNINPRVFLDQLDKYFALKGISPERRLLVIEYFLEGRAKNWFELLSNLTSYDEFKQKFLDEFFSVPIRVKIENEWATRRYDASMSLQAYYYSQLKEAAHFVPKMDEYKLNYSITQQYPQWVRENLCTVNFWDKGAIAQALVNLDAVKRDHRDYRKNQQWENHRVSGGTYSNRNLGNTWSQSNNEKPNVQGPRNTSRLPDTRYPPPNLRRSNDANRRPNIEGDLN